MLTGKGIDMDSSKMGRNEKQTEENLVRKGDRDHEDNDRIDGPPPEQKAKVDTTSITSDEFDGPPKPSGNTSEDVTAEDGRPSLFGNGKKKSKANDVPMPSTLQESTIDLNDCYKMDYTPRGYFLLINNKDFLPSSGMENYPRNGTDVDAEAIKSLFQELGFIVDAHRNLSVYEMRKYIKAAATKDFSMMGCFSCCILSHGQEGVLYGTDGTIDIREITSYFHGRNLAGKPKCFIFQACQGSEYMDGVVPDSDGEMETDGPPEGNDISLPSEADFLYAYSTVPGYYSWRNSVRGSWFIQAICEVVRRHAHKMDLIRMLTRVNQIVSTKKSQTGQRASHHKRQIASIVTQLRKEFYFFPLHGPLKPYNGSY